MTSYTPDIGDIRDDYIIENTRGHDSFLTGRSLKDERGVYGSRFDNFIRKVQADERERVLREIRMIPCWYSDDDPDGGEFDLDGLAHRPFVLATIRGMSDN